MCIYIDIHVYTHAQYVCRAYACMYVFSQMEYSCTHIHIHMHMHTPMYPQNTHIHVSYVEHTCTHPCTHKIHTCTYSHIYMHTCTYHTYIHTHTHTHTLTSIKSQFINVDIDECETNNGGCNHTCTNSDGSYTCSCNTGYTLDLDEEGCSRENIYYIFFLISKNVSIILQALF